MQLRFEPPKLPSEHYVKNSLAEQVVESLDCAAEMKIGTYGATLYGTTTNSTYKNVFPIIGTFHCTIKCIYFRIKITFR